MKLIGTIPYEVLRDFKTHRRVYSDKGSSPCITTAPPLSHVPNIGVEDNTMSKKLTIRKLTEDECYRLMGFQQEDTQACREAGQSKANIYHQAGDSIVTTCLIAIFGELFGLDYVPVIEEYAKKLSKEVTER